MNKNNFNKILTFSFLIFGLTALIFQVAFAKNLVLLFGLTAPAIATVLAVYFSGLALGSFIFGKLADRLASKVKLYIGLFIGVGIYGFFVPFLFQVLSKIIQWINQFYPLYFAGFNFFAFLLSFLVLIMPAVLIGGGFPVISKIFVRESQTLGKKISLLYFINTFGSVLGALFAGFWLIPAIGVKMTIFSAATINIILAVLLFLIFNKHQQLSSNVAGPKDDQVLRPQGASIQNSIFIYVLFLTGFLALALEVFYTKTLVLFLGSSTYAFSLVLIVFLLGIALGSLAISKFLDRLKRGYLFFGLFSGLLGFWLFITLKIFEELPFLYVKILQWFYNPQFFEEPNFHFIVFTQLLILFLIIFPATLLMGMIFPLGIKLAEPSIKKIGQGVGKLYFANTFGGVLGSLAAGFFFLPALGFQKSLVLILSIYFLLAIFFLLKEKAIGNLVKNSLIALFLGLLIFSFFVSSWSKEVLLSGVFPRSLYYLNMSEEEIRNEIFRKEILFYKEGLSQVAVVREGDFLELKINGKTDASNGIDMETQILTGALPLIFHPDPKEVLAIGLGSGISLGAVTQFDQVERITAVEIDPAVIAASKYFNYYNHNALKDPRVNMVAADARNYLYLTDRKYDVISSGPSNPWISGVSYLFTREYYQLASDRLKDDGLMLQWIQYYSFWPEDLKTVLWTFQEVFPQIYVFESFFAPDLLLVGAKSESSVLDFKMVEEKLKDKKIGQELKRISINSPIELMGRFVADSEIIEELVFDSEIHTDNKPFLEFSSPKAIYQNTFFENWETLLEMREKQSSKTEFITGLELAQTEELLRYSSFRQNWILAQLHFYQNFHQNDIEEAKKFLDKALKTGFSHPALDLFIEDDFNY